MNADAATMTRPPQHLQALARANTIRQARATLKRQVATGELRVADVVLEDPQEAHTMPLADLLMSQRRWGLTRCRRFLQTIPMSETKTVGTMTERQRAAVAHRLRTQGADATVIAPALGELQGAHCPAV